MTACLVFEYWLLSGHTPHEIADDMLARSTRTFCDRAALCSFVLAFAMVPLAIVSDISFTVLFGKGHLMAPGVVFTSGNLESMVVNAGICGALAIQVASFILGCASFFGRRGRPYSVWLAIFGILASGLFGYSMFGIASIRWSGF